MALKHAKNLEMDVQDCISCKYVMYTFIGHTYANCQAPYGTCDRKALNKPKFTCEAIFFIHALNWPELCLGS